MQLHLPVTPAVKVSKILVSLKPRVCWHFSFPHPEVSNKRMINNKKDNKMYYGYLKNVNNVVFMPVLQL